MSLSRRSGRGGVPQHGHASNPSASACSATARSARRSPSCSPSAPSEIERFTGRRPVIAGVLTRSRGDFEEILADSELIVELIGGIEPARDYVLQAMRAGRARRHRQQAAALPARRGAVRSGRASTACSCASRPPSPASCRSSACSRSRSPARPSSASTGSSTAPPTSSSPRWTQRLHLRGGAGRGSAPRLRRGRPLRRRQRPRRRREDGDPRAAGLRHARAPRPGPLRGHRAPAGRRHASTRASSASA